MIDNLISNPMKQIWINLELYFKRYEFSNFFGFFLNLSQFNSIYFLIKFIYIYHACKWQLMWCRQKSTLPRGDVWTRQMALPVCTRVCMCVCARVRRDISFLIQDNPTLHNAHMLSTRPISLISIMWDFVLF